MFVPSCKLPTSLPPLQVDWANSVRQRPPCRVRFPTSFPRLTISPSRHCCPSLRLNSRKSLRDQTYDCNDQFTFSIRFLEGTGTQGQQLSRTAFDQSVVIELPELPRRLCGGSCRLFLPPTSLVWGVPCSLSQYICNGSQGSWPMLLAGGLDCSRGAVLLLRVEEHP